MNKELRVLILEDNPNDFILIRHELKKSGIPFVSKKVETKDEFVHEIENETPDVILSDHGVPAFDGYTALSLARNRCPDIPFIFVTGSVGEVVAIETLKAGATDYVLKNRLHSLVPAIQRAIGSKVPRHSGGGVLDKHFNFDCELRNNEELEETTHVVLHDLRAPIRHIQNFIQLVRKGGAGKNDEQADQFLTKAYDCSKKLDQLIQQYVAHSNIDKTELCLMPVQTVELVRGAFEELKKSCKERKIELVVSELPELEADPVMLGLVFANLLSNAIKFSRTRQSTRIEVSCQSFENEFLFTVRDNGIGFNDHYSHKLFSLFQRLHSSEEYEGFGVGLANVKRVIQRHGGRVWAVGEEGKGAAFSFSLPQHQLHA